MKSNKKIILLVTIFLLVTFIFNYILIVSIPENPIKIRYSFFSDKEIKGLTPQGWAFFTKSPRLEEVYLYKIDTISKKIENIILKNVQSSQFFGIKRENRLISSKITTIANDIDKNLWFNYSGNSQDFLKNEENYMRLNRISINIIQPSICGLYCVVMKKPIPWSWSTLKNKINMESKLILINFKCQ
jgi:antimicrobial peptide system SdpA family protein